MKLDIILNFSMAGKTLDDENGDISQKVKAVTTGTDGK